MSRGKLYFRYGVMGAAKSTDLMTHAFNHMERNQKVVVMKSAIDTRSSTKITSRTGMEMDCVSIGKDQNPYNMLIGMMKPGDHTVADVANWVYVDEAQFLSAEQIDWLATVADCGVYVVCYGLRTDFRGEAFEGSKRLFEIADSIEELKSSCSCGNKAIINARVVDGKVTLSGEQVLIGANETYVPMCRACWRSKINESPYDECEDGK